MKAIWRALRGPLEKLVTAGLGAMIVAVPSLDLPSELSWVGGALILGLTGLRQLAEKIDPDA